MLEFWDRTGELDAVRKAAGKGLFGYVTGRRRVGKTALLVEASRRFKGVYHQAVEGTVSPQLLHLADETRERWPVFKDVTPRSWTEFFALLSRQTLPPLIVFDEFPYWAQGDPALPSILQKWIDHELPKLKTTLLVSGSSQSMLFSELLNPKAPLFGRAGLRLDLQPLSFRWFCRAMRCDESDPLSFERFSLTGGIPRHWKLLPSGGLIEQADALYFQPSALLAEEPRNWLRDEAVTGSIHKAILDFIGRGVSRPSELAARIGTAHTNLSRPLALLLQLGFIQRELPFGESTRTTKRVLYSMADAALSFFYRTYLPHRERWPLLDRRQAATLIHEHASRYWEVFCRKAIPGAARYWERDVELDLVAPRGRDGLLVAECKWREIDPDAGRRLLAGLRERFQRTALARKHSDVEFRIFSKGNLAELAAHEDAR